MKILAPPKSIDELLCRARDLAGLNLADVAAEIGVDVPKDFTRQKGWTGQLIESYLGASAGSKPQQDFVEFGIELKTLPLSYTNTPLETTYVCYAPLLRQAGVSWDTSNVKNKLQKVLWVPIEGERDIAPADRVVGSAILWQPNEKQNQQLKDDWEELMELIALGQVESITARIGQVLQLRPKAANGKALTEAIGVKGEKIMTRPRGFYLRKNFTQEVLSHSFL